MTLLMAGSLCAPAAISRADSLALRMDVSAKVVANCRLTVPALSFGTYDPLVANSSDPADASSVVIVNCTRNTAASLSFDNGLNAAMDGARSMLGPGSGRLQYQIYRDSARTQVWATGAEAIHMTSKGVAQPERLTVFGRIPARQEVEPGAYTDVLTATVDF